MKSVTIVIIIVLVLAWCPWLTKEEALSIVDARIAQLQKSNPNLCEMIPDIESITKVPFGYNENVLYDCSGEDDPVYGGSKTNNEIFVTFYKKIWGRPHGVVLTKK